MQVILLEKIHNLGNLGDKVKVKPGHGRNYLIPKGKAVPATEKNIAKFEAKRVELEKAAQIALAQAQQRAELLNELMIEIRAKAGDEGKLFGSIGPRDIAEAITAQGFKVVKSEVLLPEGPIRLIGEYQIFIELHSDLRSAVKVKIIAE